MQAIPGQRLWEIMLDLPGALHAACEACQWYCQDS